MDHPVLIYKKRNITIKFQFYHPPKCNTERTLSNYKTQKQNKKDSGYQMTQIPNEEFASYFYLAVIFLRELQKEAQQKETNLFPLQIYSIKHSSFFFLHLLLRLW